MKSLFFTFLLSIGITSMYSQSEVQYGEKRDLSFNKISNAQINLDNQVYILQIGSGNIASSTIDSEISDIRVHQSGNNNFINIDVMGQNVDADFTQYGNENKSFSFVIDPNAQVSLNLSQNGNNGHFESYGSNSISNKLQFKTNGDFKSIIVRNFK